MVGVREDRRGKIHLGDVIIAIDDEPVSNEDGMLSLLEQHQPGDSVKITSLRDETIVNYNIVLAQPET